MKIVLNKNRYEIKETLGKGGFGITYLANDTKLKAEVAIKCYCPAGIAETDKDGNIRALPGKEKQFSSEKEKFLSEARTLSSMGEINGVVRVLDCFEENNTSYIVMEYVNGVSLRAYLEELDEPLTFDKAYSLLLPVLEALEKIHKRGIIHRDICPDNLFICDYGALKLMDFGASREFDPDAESPLTRTVLGRNGYAPPEQYLAKSRQGPWTDTYALCATIYEMITLTSLPNALERMRGVKTYKPSEYGAVITYEQEKMLLDKGLALNTEDRFRNIEALKNGFFPPNDNDDDGRRKRKRIKALAVIVLLAIVITGVIQFYLGKRNNSLAGSYNRGAKEYNEFIDLLENNCTEKKYDSEKRTTYYTVSAEWVKEHRYVSNEVIIDLALDEVKTNISEEHPELHYIKTVENCKAVVEPYGIIRTLFNIETYYATALRSGEFDDEKDVAVVITSDVVSESVSSIIIFSNNKKKELETAECFVAKYLNYNPSSEIIEDLGAVLDSFEEYPQESHGYYNKENNGVLLRSFYSPEDKRFFITFTNPGYYFNEYRWKE